MCAKIIVIQPARAPKISNKTINICFHFANEDIKIIILTFIVINACINSAPYSILTYGNYENETGEYSMKKAADLIGRVLDSMQDDKIQQASGFLNKWKSVIEEVFPNHNNETDSPPILNHVRVLDVDKGIVHIEVDHPGWIQTMQFKRKQVVYKLQKAFPVLEIRTLAFHLAGDTIYNSSKNEQPLTRDELRSSIESRLPKELREGVADSVSSETIDNEIAESIKNTELEKILEKLKNTLEVVD